MDEEKLGNSHGYQCPNCKRGDQLAICANVWVDLLPTGTDDNHDRGDTEWDDANQAWCQHCDWEGTVSQLIKIELDEESVDEWTNHFYHHNTLWDDTWSCQCNDECPVCGAEIEPYASTENASGELVIHNARVHDMAENEVPCCSTCGNAECDEHKAQPTT